MLKHLYLKRKSPQKPLNTRPGRPRAGLDAVEKKKSLSSYMAIQSIAHYYTN
jgi:hypothetical protein